MGIDDLMGILGTQGPIGEVETEDPGHGADI